MVIPQNAPSLPEKPQKNTAKINKVPKARAAALSKEVVKRRRAAIQSRQGESYSSASYKHDQHKCPTLISASALFSISGCSSSFSSTSFLSNFDGDPDDDLQTEEESFIVADIHDKARLLRELLGDDDPQLRKRSPAHDWVIRK
jgi:hypothetical protein